MTGRVKSYIKAIVPSALLLFYVTYTLNINCGILSRGNIKNGETFISNERFYSSNEILLTGEWEFYFNVFINAEDITEKTEKSIRISPDYWKRDRNDNSVERNGYGTYRLVVYFETPKEFVRIYVPLIAGAYEMTINGQTALSSGIIGTTPQSEVPDINTKTALFPLNSDRMDINLKISGFMSNKSGMASAVAIGSDKGIMDFLGSETVKDAFVIGCFFIVAAYHMALFTLRHNDKSNLLFTLVCLSGLIRQGTISQGLLLNFMPENNGYMAFDIYILSQLSFHAFTLAFVYNLFGQRTRHKKIAVGFIMSIFLFSALAEIVHKYNFSWFIFIVSYLGYILCFLYIIVMLYAAIKNKTPYSIFFAYGFIYLSLSSFGDLGLELGFYKINPFADTGFVVFTFIESAILASKYTHYVKENQSLIENLESTVKKRTGELEYANRKLIEMERIRKRLMSDISHDLRTPLTAAGGFLELLLKNESLDEKSKNYVEGAYIRTQQMGKLISDLFLLTRLENKNLSLNIEHIPVIEFLEKSIYSHEPVMTQKGLNLIREFCCNNQDIMADSVRLMQVMDNLIQNALRYARTQIVVKALEDDGKIYISVIDDGKGIKEDELPLIFDRFYKNNNDGTGLGLAIVKELVMAMSGGVFVKSVPNQYTEIGFYLPESAQ